MKLVTQTDASARAHPWRHREGLTDIPDALVDGTAVDRVDLVGSSLGAGIFDRRDPVALWRRFSHLEGACLDEDYVAGAILEAIERRAPEACQRLVSSDADFLPGLTVELFQDVATVGLHSPAMRAMEAVVVEVLREALDPVDLVLCAGEGAAPRTASGNGLKPRWVEVDGLAYRVDLLRPERPGFPLALREQHALFGSLCEGRQVLDLYAHSGGFSVQAMRHGATAARALHPDAAFSKAVGANAQRNGVRVETSSGCATEFLANLLPGSFDAVVIDLPEMTAGDIARVLEAAFDGLSSGGVLAAYSARQHGNAVDLFSRVAAAATATGREARVFTRTTQPFDFPVLLSFPESQIIEGVILEVL
jgi:23S rRNA (cytosine1962-C5)-methyltransferase